MPALPQISPHQHQAQHHPAIDAPPVSKIHHPAATANVLITRGNQEFTPLTHIEIQLLLYFWHGWMLAIYDQPLHSGHYQAWQYGPVEPYVHQQLCYGKGRPITLLIPEHAADRLSAEQQGIFDTVYDYRSLGRFRLTGISQSKRGPWDVTWKRRYAGNPITNDELRDYFRGLLDQE